MKIRGMVAGLAAALVIACAVTAYGQGTYPCNGQVVSNGVNLRQAPDTTSGTIVLIMFKGDKLRVLGQQTDWYTVELPTDRPLWVHKDFVRRGTGDAGEIRGTAVNVRDGAGDKFKQLGLVGTGRKVRIIGEQGDWVNINYVSSDRGYVNVRYVQLTGQGGMTSTTTATTETDTPKPPVAGGEETGVLVDFKKAEALYETEVNKASIDNWKLDDAEKLYRQVTAKSTDALIKKTAEGRLAFIEMVKQAQASMVNPEEYRKKRDAVEAQIDEEFRKKRADILARKPSPAYLATGRVEKLASSWLKPANYKLMEGSKIVYLLYSDKQKLELYEGRYVGIIGEVDRAIKYDIPTVRVQSVDVLERKDGGEDK